MARDVHPLVQVKSMRPKPLHPGFQMHLRAPLPPRLRHQPVKQRTPRTLSLMRTHRHQIIHKQKPPPRQVLHHPIPRHRHHPRRTPYKHHPIPHPLLPPNPHQKPRLIQMWPQLPHHRKTKHQILIRHRQTHFKLHLANLTPFPHPASPDPSHLPSSISHLRRPRRPPHITPTPSNSTPGNTLPTSAPGKHPRSTSANTRR